MAAGQDKAELVFLRDVTTGNVQGVAKGSPAHLAMARSTVPDEDGIETPRWVKTRAPKKPSAPRKFRAGMQPTFVASYPGRDGGPFGEDVELNSHGKADDGDGGSGD